MNNNPAKQLEEKARAYLLNAGLSDANILALEGIGYFDAPASMRHHLAIPQGLIEHSINVAQKMLGLKAFNDPASCYKVGMLHDLCKCYCYKPAKKGTGYVWNDSGYVGHGVASMQIAADLDIELTPAERAAIVWHMGVFGMSEDDMKAYQAAVLKYPREIILTHAADHLASVFETLAWPKANEDTEEE